MTTAMISRDPSACSPETSYGPGREVILTETEIRRLLPMYREDAVFLKHAILSDGRLSAVFNTFDHPFSRPLPKHFTREHALVFITQASYVLGSLMQIVDPMWPLGTEEFQRLAMAEQATFTRVDLRFRRFVRNRDGITLNIWCTGFRRMGGRLFARFAFDFPDGCYGACEGLVALDDSLRPGLSELSH